MKSTAAEPDLFDVELLRAAVLSARPTNGCPMPRLDCVAFVFGVGLDTARALCQRFECDPAEIRQPLLN